MLDFQENMKKKVNILIIPISNPLLVGIYNVDNILINIISKDGKTSDILPEIFQALLIIMIYKTCII